MAAKKEHIFPDERFGPKLLKLIKDERKHKCTSWGPDINGLKLKMLGREWTVVACTWTAIIAESGRLRWFGKFTDAEEDFDL